MSSKLPETTISPSDDENSSIITVRSNASNNNDSMVRLNLATNDDNDVEAPTKFDGSFLTAAQHNQSSNVFDLNDENTMQTIVEVVNPQISGQGYANSITIGHSNDDGSYPLFDQNDDGNVADISYDSIDEYNMASGLSLSDKMKNVLQELVKNERVRLSFSQSISDDDDSDSEQNDTDDDANEPLRHDSGDEESAAAISSTIEPTTVAKAMEENGNAVIAQPNVVDTVKQSDSVNNDDIKNANIIDNDFIYKNPNFLMADDEIDASTSTQKTVSTVTRNERDEKLKEKLLAELNVQPSGSDEQQHHEIGTTERINNDPDEEESSISISSAPTSATIETSSKSDSISSTGSGKRKKRKNKARKK